MSRSRDDGSVTVLTLGLVGVTLMVLVGLAQAGHVFLAQRGLADTCDGAAVAGVQALDPGSVYAGRGPTVDLTRARREVAAWTPADVTAEVTGLSADGRGVLVTCRAAERVPFTAVVGIGDLTLTAHAAARLP